jgi:hypothetical protein
MARGLEKGWGFGATIGFGASQSHTSELAAANRLRLFPARVRRLRGLSTIDPKESATL